MPFCVSGLRPIWETMARADGAGADQPADAVIGPGGVIGDDCEILAPEFDQGVDDAVGAADAHETADHQHGAVGNHFRGLLRRNAFFHRPVSSWLALPPGGAGRITEAASATAALSPGGIYASFSTGT